MFAFTRKLQHFCIISILAGIKCYAIGVDSASQEEAMGRWGTGEQDCEWYAKPKVSCNPTISLKIYSFGIKWEV